MTRADFESTQRRHDQRSATYHHNPVVNIPNSNFQPFWSYNLNMFGNVNVERDFDTDMMRVWHMVQELSDQLAHNHKIVGTLKSQATVLKVRTA